MIRLNPHQWSDKAVKQDVFPSQDNYFTELFAKDYRTFLEAKPLLMTECNMLQHYGVEAQLKIYLDGSR
jgi:hypothetical protein